MRKVGIVFCLVLTFGFCSVGRASIINEIEDNSSIANAQNIDDYFSLGANVDILDPETNPWVSIQANGDTTRTHDYYSFSVGTGMTGWFDIDYGNESGTNASDMDSYLTLFNGSGSVLARNDDCWQTSIGAGGSASFFDSFIEYQFSTTGRYYVRVTAAASNPSFGEEDTYTLQVSIKDHATDPVPEPATMLLFGTGLIGLVGSRLRKKKK